MEVFQMTDEREYQVAAARAEALATIERLNGLRPRDTSFDEPREWQAPDAPEREVRYSERTTTRPAAKQTETADDYIAELLATVIAELTPEFDRKIDAVRAEVRELKAEAIRAFGDRLDRTLAKATELCDRLERREPSGTVIDLPPLPTRNRTGMN
jgi:hypothetical protein